MWCRLQSAYAIAMRKNKHIAVLLYYNRFYKLSKNKDICCKRTIEI